MPKLERILVPVDFSVRTRPALEHALGFAEPSGARIDLLHVWQPPRYGGRPGETVETLRESFEEQARAELESFVEGIEAPPHIELRPLLECGRPASTILEVIGEGDYDLLVIATSGRSGLAHFFVGSVAENLVRNSPIPVLTLRVVEDG